VTQVLRMPVVSLLMDKVLISYIYIYIFDLFFLVLFL